MGRCLEHRSYKTPEPQTGKRTGFLWAAKSINGRERTGIQGFLPGHTAQHIAVVRKMRESLERFESDSGQRSRLITEKGSSKFIGTKWLFFSKTPVLYLITALRWQEQS